MAIGGITKTEANYRAVMLDSSSSLKEFSMNRKKYFKKYILGEKLTDDEDDINYAATMGRIVETLLLEPEEFDNRFYMSACAKMPTGLMLDFVEALYHATSKVTDEQGVVQADFEDIAQQAYVKSGFKIKIEAVLGKFIGSDNEIYYNEIRKVRANNLTVVTTQDVTNAERIVEELKNNFVTSGIINLVDSDRWMVLNQHQIEGYDVDGHLFKSMLDKIIVDHTEKTVSIYDLKCTWSVEGFYKDYYLYRRAYIQGYLYYMAVLSLTKKEDSEVFGYTVNTPKFIVCDSTNYYNPLIYSMDAGDLLDAYQGFSFENRYYPGVKELIADLIWATDNNIWNISRTNHVANGIINIKGNGN